MKSRLRNFWVSLRYYGLVLFANCLFAAFIKTLATIDRTPAYRPFFWLIFTRTFTLCLFGGLVPIILLAYLLRTLCRAFRITRLTSSATIAAVLYPATLWILIFVTAVLDAVTTAAALSYPHTMALMQKFGALNILMGFFIVGFVTLESLSAAAVGIFLAAIMGATTTLILNWHARAHCCTVTRERKCPER